MLEHDVLVIGAGLAGQRAAIEASRKKLNAAIISKVYAVRSHSNAAQGGINAAVRENDSWESHAFDTVKGSDYLGDQDAIEILCREARHDIIELEHMGVIFNRDEDGLLGTRPFGGATYARTCFVADITGQAILHVMNEQLMKARVPVYDEFFVTSLIIDDGVCCGAVAMELATGKVYPIGAKAVILATGGLGRVYEPSTNALIVTGDGMSLAYRAGAPLMDMEMVQFHPTTLPSNGALITEAARGEGAYLLNANGERFLKNYDPVKMELGTRDVISRAEQTEINEGRGVDGSVLLDCTHLGKERILKNLSQIYELALSFANVDITKEPVPVRPGMHYQMGGVSTDINGLTSVPGLYAVGECACVSVHGANRLGANSLLETVVYGRRAGEAAAEYAQATASRRPPDQATRMDEQRITAVLEREGPGENAALLRLELGRMMHDLVGIFRNKTGLERAIDAIHDLRGRYERITVADKGHVFNYALEGVWELGYMLDCAETIAASALDREESRGAHYRLDFPHRDNVHWLKHTLVFHSPEGPRVDYRPVRVTRWEPERRVF